MEVQSKLKILALAIGIQILALPLVGEASSPVASPWLRLPDAPANLSLNRQGTWLAFTRPDGSQLQLLNLETSNVYLVTPHVVGPSIFWSPDGFRLFYRKSFLSKGSDQINSAIQAYDVSSHRWITVDQFPFQTGYLTFDPKDKRMYLMTPAGIRSNRLYSPDERLARWQIALRNTQGSWNATQTSIIWLTHGGLTLNALEDDLTGIESFDISPDGRSIAWATNKHRVYISREGAKPHFVGYGRDPKWHPNRTLLVYAGARRIGNRNVSYDVRLYDLSNNTGRFLTALHDSNQRWPIWCEKGQRIYYTRERSTDLFELEFKL